MVNYQGNSVFALSDEYIITVYEQKRWKLKRKTDDAVDFNQYESMIFHRCERRKKEVIMNAIESTICEGCNQYIPDELQALWILHNVKF